MSLKYLLSEKRPAIIKRWLESIFETYPAETSIFLSKQKDQFANPIGHTFSQAAEAIFNALLGDAATEESGPFIESIMRIRAVQEGSPSQAVVFIFSLKGIVREMLGKALKESNIAEEMVEFDAAIDALALRAFDSFVKCREKIYELKANETKNMTFRLLQKARLLGEIPGENLDQEENSSDKPKTKEVAE